MGGGGGDFNLTPTVVNFWVLGDDHCENSGGGGTGTKFTML